LVSLAEPLGTTYDARASAALAVGFPAVSRATYGRGRQAPGVTLTACAPAGSRADVGKSQSTL